MLPRVSVLPFALAAAAVVGWRARSRSRCEVASLVILVLYAGWIVSMTLFPLPTDTVFVQRGAAEVEFSWNVVPLRTIARQVEFETSWQKVRQLGGNVLVFAPLGLLLPLSAPRLARLSRVVVGGFAFSFGIEFAQLAISGVLGYSYRITDVDDILLNVAGVVLGYAAYLVAHRVL